MVSKNNNVNKNKNVININIDSKKKRKRTTKKNKKRGNNIGSTLSYPSSTTNNYITSNPYSYNGNIPPTAPARLNRNQILDHNTLSGNKNIQNEIKQIQTYNLQSQRDKMQAARLLKFQNENESISDLTSDFHGSIASSNSFASGNPISTGNFYGSIASGNSAYSNHDQIHHQPDDSTVHSSFNNSTITPGYYYDHDYETHLRLANSSRYNKLQNNTKPFTTPMNIPTLPTNILQAENEGELSGDNRNTENSVAHSSHHRDNPNEGYDVLPNETYDGNEVYENYITQDINTSNEIAPQIVDYEQHIQKSEPVQIEQGVGIFDGQQLKDGGEEVYENYIPQDINAFNGIAPQIADNYHHIPYKFEPAIEAHRTVVENVVTQTLEEQLAESRARKDKLYAEEKQYEEDYKHIMMNV